MAPFPCGGALARMHSRPRWPPEVSSQRRTPSSCGYPVGTGGVETCRSLRHTTSTRCGACAAPLPSEETPAVSPDRHGKEVVVRLGARRDASRASGRRRLDPPRSGGQVAPGVVDHIQPAPVGLQAGHLGRRRSELCWSGSLEERQRKTFPSGTHRARRRRGLPVVPHRTERVASPSPSSPSTPPGRPAARRHTAEIGTEPYVGGDSFA